MKPTCYGKLGKKELSRLASQSPSKPAKKFEEECEDFLTPGSAGFNSRRISAAARRDIRPAVRALFLDSLQLKPDVPSPSGAITRVVQNVPIH